MNEGYAYYWAGLIGVGLFIAGVWATVLVNRVVQAVKDIVAELRVITGQE